MSREQEWTTPSYSTIERIVRQLDPALMTLAHEGSKVYREEFDLLYRHEINTPNEVWQADLSLLAIWILNEQSKPAKPWLTIILDYSRGVAGYYLGFQSPTTLQTARPSTRPSGAKPIRAGICVAFLPIFTPITEQILPVSIWNRSLLISKWSSCFPGHPRGRGKIERFFRTVEQMLLPHLPGFVGENGKTGGTSLSLSTFDACFRTWLLEDYHHRVQEEINSAP